MLVGKNNIRVSFVVSRSLEVVDFEVLVLLISVIAEEEVFVGNNSIKCIGGKGGGLLFSHFLLKSQLLHFMVDNLTNFRLHFK